MSATVWQALFNTFSSPELWVGLQDGRWCLVATLVGAAGVSWAKEGGWEFVVYGFHGLARRGTIK